MADRLLDTTSTLTLLNMDSDETTQLEFLIDWIVSRAESYIGRKLESAEYTWYLDGRNSSLIVLPVCPVTTVSGIYLDSSRKFATALASTAYYCESETGIVNLYYTSTPVGAKTVKIVATAGYTQSTLPSDLKMAFVSAISHHAGKLTDRAFGVASQTSPDGMNVSYELELPSDTKRVLDSYKEVRT